VPSVERLGPAIGSLRSLRTRNTTCNKAGYACACKTAAAPVLTPVFLNIIKLVHCTELYMQ
jgi:hypothetical protein